LPKTCGNTAGHSQPPLSFSLVTTDLLPALLTGAFGLGGVLGGVLLSGHVARRAEQQRIIADDAKRWQADRRHSYALNLSHIESMLTDIYGTSALLSYDGTKPIEEEDIPLLVEDVIELYDRWENELQPAVREIQLLAGVKVAESADRTSWALMELIGYLDSKQTSQQVGEYSKRTQYLIQTTRNAMRAELGLADPVMSFPMPKNWPWLPDDDGAG